MARQKTFLRSCRLAASSTAASLVDLLTLITLIRLAQMAAGLAGGLGCLAGGVVNFLLCRSWVFSARGPGWLGQLLVYLGLIVLGGALLSGGIIHLAVAALGLPVLLAKAIAALLVLGCWNYPVSARLIFANGKER